MPERPFPLNLPLKVRGIKGGYFHNSPCPSYLKRGNIENIDEIRLLGWQDRGGARPRPGKAEINSATTFLRYGFRKPLYFFYHC